MGDISQILNDPIHKIINLHPLWIKIIDTPEFQRLRYIKQLGCTYFIYPSATHTRFEHSIGVCYLADRMVRLLKAHLEAEFDPEIAADGIRITEQDCLCVSLAGLCHDLGHGPFSHLWKKFMRRATSKKNWKHEDFSVQIFDRIWVKLKTAKIDMFGLDEDHKKIICDMITGFPQQSQQIIRGKQFLYEIVTNKKNGVDVDKWDYLCRDSYYLGFEETLRFQYEKLMKCAKVQVDKNTRETSIWYNESERPTVFQMFYNRWLFHRKAYNHRITRIMGQMIVDAFLEADKDPGQLKLLTKGRKLSELEDDLDSYLELNDSLLHWLKLLKQDHPARILLDRIEKRYLYKCVGCFFSPVVLERAGVLEEIKEIVIRRKIKEHILGRTNYMGGFYVDVAKFDFGMGRENPMEKIHFYSSNPRTPNDNQPSRFLPNEFKEYQIMCIIRDDDETQRAKVQTAFKDWFDQDKKELKLFDFSMPSQH